MWSIDSVHLYLKQPRIPRLVFNNDFKVEKTLDFSMPFWGFPHETNADIFRNISISIFHPLKLTPQY